LAEVVCEVRTAPTRRDLEIGELKRKIPTKKTKDGKKGVGKDPLKGVRSKSKR